MNQSTLKALYVCIREIVTLPISDTVRPRDTRPQAARTLTVHDFELGQKKLEKHVF